MRNVAIYLTLSLCLFAGKITAQETFNQRVRNIANKIEQVTKEEKAALKKEVEAVNIELEQGQITAAEAETKKKNLATIRANNIETMVAVYEAELKDVVEQKVAGKIKDKDSARVGILTIHWDNWEKDASKRDSIRNRRSESRTTSQFVFAAGVNNLVTDGAVANSDFRYWGSHFYEWGISWNTRIAKDNNLLHFKYGVSLMYNNLRPTDNRLFVDTGSQTELLDSGTSLQDSRFRNVNLVVPMHLEFDFSKKKVYDGKTVFKTHQGFRFGIGGFAGVNVKTKQILEYDVDGYDTRQITKGSFNTNDFVYGLSTYIGYKETSLYLKYDVSPLFKDNAIDQNNISLGIRFDLN